MRTIVIIITALSPLLVNYKPYVSGRGTAWSFAANDDLQSWMASRMKRVNKIKKVSIDIEVHVKKVNNMNLIIGLERKKSCIPFCYDRDAVQNYKKWITVVSGQRIFFCVAPNTKLCMCEGKCKWLLYKDDPGDIMRVVKKTKPRWTMVEGNKQYMCYADCACQCPSGKGLWRPWAVQNALDYFKGSWFLVNLKKKTRFFCNGNLVSCPPMKGKKWQRIKGTPLKIWRKIRREKTVGHRLGKVKVRKGIKVKLFCLALDLKFCKFPGNGDNNKPGGEGDEDNRILGVSDADEEEGELWGLGEGKSNRDNDGGVNWGGGDSNSIDVSVEGNHVWKTKVGGVWINCHASKRESCPRLKREWRSVKGVSGDQLRIIDYLVNQGRMLTRLKGTEKGCGCAVYCSSPDQSKCPQLTKQQREANNWIILIEKNN